MAAAWWVCGFLSLLAVAGAAADRAERKWGPQIRMPTEKGYDVVTRWAVLIAGSKNYINYRHQADVCHAYQILKQRGVKEEHIVVFMYDDIAYHSRNPRPGIIINNPEGADVYAGVPKDYTGDQVTKENLFAVLLGNKTALTGGSGKVIDSKPQDHIFIFYSDHGGPGVLSMPNPPYLYAGDFITVLQKMHASHSYSKMVIYVEACESGSIFEGQLLDDLNIYATTAANATEDSWATYCPPLIPGYDICVGDLYSVSWMEDSETHNPMIETLGDQYVAVRARTEPTKSHNGSHVMEYGDKTFRDDKLFYYQGDDLANANTANRLLWPDLRAAVKQRDADVLFMWKRYEQLTVGSEEKLKALREIKETLVHREHLDSSIDFIGKLVFGFANGPSVLEAARSSGQPLVDDWDCLKTMVRIFESQCGSLTYYGMKHTRAFANICNNGVSEAKMKEASISACSSYDSTMWSPVTLGYSA